MSLNCGVKYCNLMQIKACIFGERYAGLTTGIGLSYQVGCSLGERRNNDSRAVCATPFKQSLPPPELAPRSEGLGAVAQIAASPRASIANDIGYLADRRRREYPQVDCGIGLDFLLLGPALLAQAFVRNLFRDGAGLQFLIRWPVTGVKKPMEVAASTFESEYAAEARSGAEQTGGSPPPCQDCGASLGRGSGVRLTGATQ
jgi:hypothetical protein